MMVYKNKRAIEDLISYEDYLKITGLNDETLYESLMDGPLEHCKDGDFIVKIDLSLDDVVAKQLKEVLPIDVVERNKFGIEYQQ
ncbi:hypothetical protein JZU46_00760 [bacterium]|nr:hypothetical protein [bacterium]